MDKQNLSERIKEIRFKLGKSQEEFGLLFEPPAPKSAVSRWEHGGKPNKKRIKRIAEIGNVSVDYLLNGSITQTVAESRSEYEKLLDKATNNKLTSNDKKRINELKLETSSMWRKIAQPMETEEDENDAYIYEFINFKSKDLQKVDKFLYGKFIELMTHIQNLPNSQEIKNNLAQFILDLNLASTMGINKKGIVNDLKKYLEEVNK